MAREVVPPVGPSLRPATVTGNLPGRKWGPHGLSPQVSLGRAVFVLKKPSNFGMWAGGKSFYFYPCEPGNHFHLMLFIRVFQIILCMAPATDTVRLYMSHFFFKLEQVDKNNLKPCCTSTSCSEAQTSPCGGRAVKMPHLECCEI